MPKIRIIYRPNLDPEEKKILNEVFGQDNITFAEYKTKGIMGGAFDVHIIIDLLNHPAVTAIINGTALIGLVTLFVKRLFQRNSNKIMDLNTRPRYTTLTIRREKYSIVISNINKDNKTLMLKHSLNFKGIDRRVATGDVEYTEDKLKEYLADDK